MQIHNGAIGIVSELDEVNMKARVQWPVDDVLSNWLQIIHISGFYNMPDINDQVLCFYDEEHNAGVIIGTVVLDGKAPYQDGDVLGLKLGKIELKIAKSTGALTIISDGEVNVTASKVAIDANSMSLTGDLSVNGESDLKGNIKAGAKIDAVGAISTDAGVEAMGIIKSNTDVQTPTVKLLTHLHGTAAPGAPTTPPIPG